MLYKYCDFWNSLPHPRFEMVSVTSCLQDKMKDIINLEHTCLFCKICLTNWQTRTVFPLFLVWSGIYKADTFFGRKELQRVIFKCFQKTLTHVIWGSKPLVSKPEPNFKQVIFSNRQEILKTSLKRRAWDTERTKWTNGT